MAGAIGGTGMNAIGAMLAGGQPQSPAGGPNGPPPSGNAPPPSANDPAAMSGAPGFAAQDQMLEQTMGAIRQVGEMVKALADMIPMGTDEIQQIQQLLKALVVKSAQGAPTQTPSSMAVPGNGGGA